MNIMILDAATLNGLSYQRKLTEARKLGHRIKHEGGPVRGYEWSCRCGAKSTYTWADSTDRLYDSHEHLIHALYAFHGVDIAEIAETFEEDEEPDPDEAWPAEPSGYFPYSRDTKAAAS